jgi:4-diphosphocytidyl-2-C-methyl-D-erythritol kinase
MRLVANAKLTVSLHMVGVRPDGYHVIDAEMVSLDLADTLTLRSPVDQTTVSYVGLHGGEVEPGGDLVSKALALVGRTAGVEVDKQIPAMGGLGGGSSDAAAILRWAGSTDVVGASELGADVSFCLVGGRARVQGIGEIVTPLPFADRAYTLLVPPLRCSTPAVYKRWDDMGGPVGEHGNDLEPAALALEPRLAAWRDRLGEETGAQPRLAGSGATWFVEGAFPGADRIVAQTVARQ